MLIDTHTHLYLEQFDNDRELVMEAARDAGIGKMFLPNIEHAHTGKLLEMCLQYPEVCYPMTGLHPTHVKDDWPKELELIRNSLKNQQFYGIGETGIDLYWDKSTLEWQQQSFREHISMAKEFNLPIIIHARDSFDEILEILEAENSKKLFGIFHCFTGTLEQAERILKLQGFKLGIGGVVTFKNSGLDKVVAGIDLSNIVLETDSPYLAPAPFRGKRNESAYLVKIAEKLAEIYNLPFDDIERITTKNARLVFHI